MNERIRASVAMAVYNGERYINEQIDSILGMMSSEDELIISYNESEDATWDIIQNYQRKDPRVKVYTDTGCSVESNFNNAVKYCTGKYIFLSDQDDVWINNKIDVMVNYMESHPDVKVLISDGYDTDQNLVIESDLYEKYHTTANAVKNFVKGTYLGCQMLFDASIKDKIWPVKVKPPIAHDLWLGIVGAFYGRVVMIDEKLIMHRLHSDNYTKTSKMSLLNVIKNRLYFAYTIVTRLVSNRRQKSNI